MTIIQPPSLGESHPCPYLPGRTARLARFYATGLSARELDGLLAQGWRKFGLYYFRPACRTCAACIPVRVRVNDFRPGASQRKILRRNRDVEVRFGDLRCTDEIFAIYRDHSWNRFRKKAARADFEAGFFSPSCPSLQSEYYLGEKLIAVGFLDAGVRGLSSVYFVFRTQYSRRGLGILSIMCEIEYARSRGLPYYYLGYCVAENRSLNYKARFHPQERFDWDAKEWRGTDGKSQQDPGCGREIGAHGGAVRRGELRQNRLGRAQSRPDLRHES